VLMWIRLTDTSAFPNVQLTLDETYLLQCDYRITSDKKAIIACMKLLQPLNEDLLETKIQHFMNLEDFQVDLYSGDALIKSARACFNAFYIQEGIRGSLTVERAEFMVGCKNKNGVMVGDS
jgi:hypothetical protein